MRIATFNVENLDDQADSHNPPLAVRAPVLRAAMERLRADIVCLQEVHGQELPDHTSDHPRRALTALDAVLAGTDYAGFQRAVTLTSDVPYNERNLVILSAHPIVEVRQYRNDLVDELMYRKVTSTDPSDQQAKPLTWQRPILHAQIEVPQLGRLHVINLHLKSRIPGNVPGQLDGYQWRSAAGWAEGYFMSAIRRVGQALEARILLDSIFEQTPDANVVVCGDFNAEPGEVPVEAISGRVENTDNPALRPRVMIACSSGIPASVRFSHLHHGEGNLLDHMLISQSLLPRFIGAAVHNENLHDESLPFTFDTKYPESDHAPFVAEFS